jgi:hypothetical protein
MTRDYFHVPCDQFFINRDQLGMTSVKKVMARTGQAGYGQVMTRLVTKTTRHKINSKKKIGSHKFIFIYKIK